MILQNSREFLLNYPRDLDNENGFGLVHYLTLLIQSKLTMAERKKAGRTKFASGFGFGFGAATTAPSFTNDDDMDTTSTNSEAEDVQLLGQMIKELNLDVNMKTSSGKTPLLLVCEAVSESSLNLVKMLIELGASVNVAVSLVLKCQSVKVSLSDVEL